MKRSGAERILMGTGMFEAARSIVIASLPQGLSPVDLRWSIFERFYGQDLPKDTMDWARARILES